MTAPPSLAALILAEVRQGAHGPEIPHDVLVDLERAVRPFIGTDDTFKVCAELFTAAEALTPPDGEAAPPALGSLLGVISALLPALQKADARAARAVEKQLQIAREAIAGKRKLEPLQGHGRPQGTTAAGPLARYSMSEPEKP